MFDRKWHDVSIVRFSSFTAGLILFIALILSGEPGFVFVLDGANLLFHEAGHFFFGLLGPVMELYGGTLGQFVFPSVLIVSFWRQGLPISFAVGLIWFFENLFNVARYVADSRAMILPLVGGGSHDWNSILTRWNMLEQDLQISSILQIIGWGGIAAAWLWIAWRTWASRKAQEPLNASDAF